ncbi:MAG: trimethylamine methyltransferase family protein [Chloroflexi bacterium]|nr:trimethylamine methyltransferase family protein [Chloroflexota bacterium]MCA2002069.1 trimethylamine methyltransferase family protein [Chloroflexota bacterium]
MRFSSQLLTESEKEQVHKETLQVLEKAGVRYHSQKALKLLEKNGARIDWEKYIAYIPPALVEQTLATCPKSFTLGARNPKFDYPMPSPVSRYALDGTAAFAQDFYTGEHRYGTAKDNENGLRVFQAMDMGIMTWAPVSAEDKPAHTRPLHEWYCLTKFSSKHANHELHTVEQAPYLAEMLSAVMGGEEALRASHAYSLIYCPVSPLMHDGPMMEAYFELGSLDLPIMTLPMPVPGMTGPASLFGNICIANAEALSSIVAYQLDHPGRPMIYSSATGTTDMRTGAYTAGTPEMGLMSAALVEMGRFYDLPACSAGCTADARQPGAEAVLEKIISTLPPVLVGSEILIGFGEIEGDQLLVLEQIVVDNEIAHFCERVFEGIDSNPEKVLTSDILDVGPGGHFLSRKSTRKLARSNEVRYADLLDRHTLDQWMQLGKPSMYSNARKKVEEILAAPLEDPLPDAVVGQLDEILARADRELE